MRSPSEYNDEELIDVFWHVDRDRYPERYSEICKELDVREISYECLDQFERNLRKHDKELETMGEATRLIGAGYRYLIAATSLAGLIYAYFRN